MEKVLKKVRGLIGDEVILFPRFPGEERQRPLQDLLAFTTQD
jgi:hypothetical protein